MLFDLVADRNLPSGAPVVDVGCGEGGHAVELAKRFAFTVSAIDPVPRHIQIAKDCIARQAADVPHPGSVSFEVASAEHLPVETAGTDLIWCRDVLVHVEDLNQVYGEFRRVLKPGGHALVYQMFATNLLEPREAERLLPVMGCVPTSMDPVDTETAIAAAGLRIDRRIVLGTEWGEYGQEHSGKAARQLLHAARLLRDPELVIGPYGQANYDIALGDCLWHVYRMIGKLSDRIYLLSAPPAD